MLSISIWIPLFVIIYCLIYLLLGIMKLNVIIITSEASSIAISVPCFHNWSIKMDCRNTSKTSFKKWNMALSNWLWLLLSCVLFLSRQSKWKRKNRSNHLRCSLRKGVLRTFAKFTGKHLCQGLYFNKVAGLQLC